MEEITLIQDNTYYIKNPTNIGIYKENNDVWLIDTGNDKDAGRKILKLINEKGWTIKGIILTHSNADHTGGAKFIQDRTNCLVLAHNIELAISKNPILEPSFLYGGFPFKELRNKFLMASSINNIKELKENIPTNFEIIDLPGHFFNQIGIKTPDNIYFLGDSLFSEETIQKYHLFFIYDVEAYLNTLEYLKTLNGNYYILSHNVIIDNLSKLIEINKNKIIEIINTILKLLNTPMTIEKLMKEIFNHYNLTMNLNQYVLLGSTIRSYLSYLKDKNLIMFEFIDNEMIWRTL